MLKQKNCILLFNVHNIVKISSNILKIQYNTNKNNKNSIKQHNNKALRAVNENQRLRTAPPPPLQKTTTTLSHQMHRKARSSLSGIRIIKTPHKLLTTGALVEAQQKLYSQHLTSEGRCHPEKVSGDNLSQRAGSCGWRLP